MRNLVSKGDTVTLTASRTVTSGQGMLRGVLFGVAVSDTANAVAGEFALEGIFTLPKVAAQAQAEGALVYWDNTNFNVTTTSAGNTKIGTVATVGGLLAAATAGNYRITSAL